MRRQVIELKDVDGLLAYTSRVPLIKEPGKGEEDDDEEPLYQL